MSEPHEAFRSIQTDVSGGTPGCQISTVPMRERIDFRHLKYPHLAASICLLAFVSWGLLSTAPFAAVKRSPLSFVTTISDLIMHCGAYSTLAVVCLSLSMASREPRVARVVLISLVVHGLGTEVLQNWIPRRTCDPLDALANMAGIAVGALFVSWFFSPRFARSASHG